MPTPFWLYRCGIYTVDSNSHRAIISQTFVSTSDPGGNTVPLLHGLAFAQNLWRPFGDGVNSAPHFWREFVEMLHPQRITIKGFVSTPLTTQPGLNPAAPEACVRLQRVGAAGTGSNLIGRLCIPVLDDTLFLDRPHRRHVDASFLQSKINANLGAQPSTLNFGFGDYSLCIFHRRTFTWNVLDHYRVLPSTVRIWQRAKVYPWAIRGGGDSNWVPAVGF